MITSWQLGSRAWGKAIGEKHALQMHLPSDTLPPTQPHLLVAHSTVNVSGLATDKCGHTMTQLPLLASTNPVKLVIRLTG